MLNKNDYKIFSYFSIFWIMLAWLAFALTLSGFFYWWILTIFTGLFIVVGFMSFSRDIFKISHHFLITNIFLAIVIIIFAYFSSPTIFSGRDQASLSQASIRLAQFHQLKFSTPTVDTFFDINSLPEKKMNNCLKSHSVSLTDIYCQAISGGKALNFPGFYYTPDGNLITQFPLAYISWLAIFYTFLGINGFIIANAILFYIFSISFFLLIHKIAQKNNTVKYSNKITLHPSLIALIIVLTSFSFMWFFKFTLSENMALALLWLGILQLIILTKSKLKNLSEKKISWVLLFLSLSLLIFTRIEGLGFFIIAFFVLLFNKNSKKAFHHIFPKIILPFLIFLLLVFIWNIKVDIYFYKAIIKALSEPFSNNLSGLVNKNDFSTFNLFIIFAIYGILTPLFWSLFKILSLIKNKKYPLLIPLLVISPTLLYFFNSQITPDHPWMLRRFVFAILPASILYSSLLINDLLEKKRQTLAGLIFFSILLFSLYPFTKYLTFRPSENLLAETKKLSNYFSTKDLILIDRMASGNNWEMIADSMNSIFNKNAVYFFNPDDLKKIDIKKYDRIYLIIPDEKIDYYKNSFFGNSLIFKNNYSIKLEVLNSNKLSNFSLPEKQNIITNGIIFEIKK